MPPLPFGKSAVDILTDFIKYLFMSARKHIEEHHMGFNWTSIENSIEFIFSHPNGWEGPQQQKYREAIERAGLIPRTIEGRARVHMITEGEASFHYCVSSLPEEPANSKPQAIVVIDAGGGTIDLSIYSVTFNPIACREVAPAECMQLTLTSVHLLIPPFSRKSFTGLSVRYPSREESHNRQTSRLASLQYRGYGRHHTRIRSNYEACHP